MFLYATTHLGCHFLPYKTECKKGIVTLTLCGALSVADNNTFRLLLCPHMAQCQSVISEFSIAHI